ncbi:MAG: heme biosynthesis protein HemY [Blastochloris viridis]|uniref:Heme biosynthesis protein HemY n=1 Tax=Blastochloris viridis TaxID=1079 RepID=A0A6N4R5S5_BLAVI|nr:MAG: heme biosynthesis protein HemY [Blastochloris viridis]
MKSAFTAILVLGLLLVVAWLLALWGTAPLPVTLTINTTVLHTSVPVAIMLVLAVLVLTFYVGRLTGWFLRLPGQLLHIRNRKAGQQLIDAYSAYLLEDLTEAQKRLKDFKADTETHAILADMLRLRDNLDTATMPERLEKHLANPSTVVLAAWAGARAAAHQSQWDEVARITALGREHAPQHLPLRVLQFKALCNLGDPQASTLLPLLKTDLGAANTKLIGQILQGPDATTARPLLESRFVKDFELWLATPSEDLPQ